MWMEEGCNYKKLNGGEPGHGWRWDAHSETWMGLRWDLAGIEMQNDGVEGRLGWIWNANHGTWMEVRRDLGGVQALISKRGLVWDRTWMEELWCKYYHGGEARILGPWWNLGTWMEVRRYMDVGETRILGPGCRWERTWKHLTSTCWDLYGFEVTWKQPRCSFRDLDGVETSLGKGEIQVSGSGWRWDGTWMEVRRKYQHLDGGEMLPE